MYHLTKEFNLYASHSLKDQGGRCTVKHGHGYKISLTLNADKLDDKNMIIDTYDLKTIWKSRLPATEIEGGKGDHVDLNIWMSEENPTMEFMAKWIYDLFKPALENLFAVTVKETDSSYVIYSEI